MSKLEELLNKECPDGVEYVELSSVINYEQPSKYIVENTKYNDDYDTPVLTAGQTFILGYTNEKDGIYKASKKEPVIIFDDFTTSFHWVDFNFKVKSSAMKMLKVIDENKSNFIYLYYCMKNIKYVPLDHTRQWIEKYSKFMIPLPPIKVQKEIVRILDEFIEKTTKLQELLHRETILRKKQYEYYRDKLLTFNDDIEWKNLSEIAEIGTGSSNTNEEIENGKYPFFVRSQEVRSKNEYEYDETAIITSGDGVGVGKIFHYIEGKYALHQRAYRIHIIDENVIPKYYFYYMKTTFLSYIEKTSFHSSVTSIRRPMLDNYPVPVPPLEEQKRIVNILDKFDALCNDITKGLPAEIELRKKQYEYYRDKLLTFKEKKK